MAVDLGVEPSFEPLAQRRSCRCRQTIERAGGAQGWFEQGAAGRKAGEHMTFPCNCQAAAILDGKVEGMVIGIDQRPGAAVKLIAQPAFGGRQQQPLVG